MASRAKAFTRPKTKIVCTMGPSTASAEVITELIESGMNVARLNLSHGELEEHERMIDQIRSISAELGIPVGIMVDVPGAKYRTGPIELGVIELVKGDRITLTSRNVPGTREVVSVAPPGIHRDAAVGRPVLVDDGFIELSVLDVDAANQDVICRVEIPGRITERRGVTTPGKSPSQPFPDERAKVCMRFAAKQKADFVAVSTVISAADVDAARAVLDEDGYKSYIISKVERAEALEHFSEILAASDAIMVARGDMGVEVPLSRVPVEQKRLITASNIAGKPVITATQMLESMIRSQVPTRAEVTDVANAIYDGTDAIMLSGETSIGLYPVQAVKVMVQVALEAEAALPYDRLVLERAANMTNDIDDAISYSACRIANQIGAALIVAFTESGSTAGRVSKYRPRPPILALTPYKDIQRKLTLRWAVTPVIIEGPKSVDGLFELASQSARELSQIGPGSRLVITAGLPIGVTGGTNLLRVIQLSDSD